jgi:hypothetical protein
MRPLIRRALQLLVVVAVLVGLQLSVAVVGPESTPYTSSLSAITAGMDAFAAGCGYRNCQFRGERPYCSSTTYFTKCAQHGHECVETPC